MCVSLVLGIGLASPALADEGALLIDVPGDGHGFVRDSTVPILHDLDLAPGYSTSGTFEVRNSSAYDVVLNLRATEVLQAENDCLRQEVDEGDTTCTGSGGELGNWLEVTLSRVSDTGNQQLWTGPLDELASGVDLAPRLPARAVLALRVTVTLPRAATNETMTDSVSFGLRLNTAAGGDAALGRPGAGVAGATVAVAPPVDLDDGVDVDQLLLLGIELLLLLLGGASVVARRRRAHVALQVS